ncbi:SLBB domain-containing protein [Legionella sp. CNM-4043-24]|uniref:SLBB domain-containing protein n=1 Tax=Legionella sp. CNM-4043-24 TaxID=3421646 RepID=UPI00403A9BE4
MKNMNRLFLLLICLVGLICFNPLFAQAAANTPSGLSDSETNAGLIAFDQKNHEDDDDDESTSATQFSSLAFSSPQNTRHSNNNIKINQQDRVGAFIHDQLPVFGQNLFGTQCLKFKQTRFFNPKYLITVGDQINLQMWGAYQFNKELLVDTQGNIFIPEVGPVKVEGVENRHLNNVIQLHVKKIFKRDVSVYADLVSVQPVQVYVTGFVNSPGLYDGLSSNSVIYFLCAAGGINLKEGSFRSIHVLRNSKVIHDIDLYDFILRGQIEPFQLHQGDTIVVNSQKYNISAAGAVKNPYQYEWKSKTITMATLANLVNVDPSVTFVRIQRNSGNKPLLIYKPISEAMRMDLQSGDSVSFVADNEVEQIIVTVKGQVKGHHQYVLKSGSTLADLMKQVQVTPEARLQNLQLFRESIAKQQKEAISSSLARFERQVMTSTPTSDEDAKTQAAQSDMIMKFIQGAKNVKTQGQIVIGDMSRWSEIPLENNDIINVPAATSVVTVSGDVVNAVSIKAEPNYGIQHYINAAGGFNQTADTSKALLIKQNGNVYLLALTRGKNSSVRIEGGDQIIIVSKVTSEGWKLTGVMSKIAYQMAIAARVALTV